jgi:hypothetical protein
MSLQTALQQAVASYAHSQPDYRDNDPARTKRLAVTVLDAFSGEVLALPSWPYADSTTPGFQTRLERVSGSRQRRMLANHNLSPHVIGSTVKPMLFSAIASGLRPTRRLEEFYAVPHPYEQYDEVGGVRFSPPYPKDKTLNEGPAAISPTRFLVESRDWPAILYGFMGTLRDDAQLQTSLVRAGDGDRGDLQYRNSHYRLDFLRIPDGPFTWGNRATGDQETTPVFPSVEVNRIRGSMLMRQLPRIAGIRVDDVPESEDWNRTRCQRFLPSFVPTRPDEHVSPEVTKLLPDTRILVPTNLQNPRLDLLNLCIGAGEFGRFDNVTMAQAAARLVTGKDVTVTLEKRMQYDFESLVDLPKPVSERRWRNSYLIEPLHGVAETKGGTAFTTARQQRLTGVVSRPYYAVYKTGTIGQETDFRGRIIRYDDETLLFVVGKRRADGSFVPGQTVAGYLYMEQGNDDRYGTMRKFQFARDFVLPAIVEYLRA